MQKVSPISVAGTKIFPRFDFLRPIFHYRIRDITQSECFPRVTLPPTPAEEVPTQWEWYRDLFDTF